MCGGEEQTHTADNKSGGMSVYVRVIVQTLEFVMLPDAVLVSADKEYYDLNSLAGFDTRLTDCRWQIYSFTPPTIMNNDL